MLVEKHCVPCEGGTPALSAKKSSDLLKQIPGWELNPDHTTITRTFDFKDFARTIAFVNAVAYIAVCEDHHPDIEFGYNYCRIRYSTHSVHGLSENDFICAAKVNALV